MELKGLFERKKIVSQPLEPENKNVVWLNSGTKKLMGYVNGVWQDLPVPAGGDGGSSTYEYIIDALDTEHVTVEKEGDEIYITVNNDDSIKKIIEDIKSDFDSGNTVFIRFSIINDEDLNGILVTFCVMAINTVEEERGHAIFLSASSICYRFNGDAVFAYMEEKETAQTMCQFSVITGDDSDKYLRKNNSATQINEDAINVSTGLEYNSIIPTFGSICRSFYGQLDYSSSELSTGVSIDHDLAFLLETQALGLVTATYSHYFRVSYPSSSLLSKIYTALGQSSDVSAIRGIFVMETEFSKDTSNQTFKPFGGKYSIVILYLSTNSQEKVRKLEITAD